MNLLCAKIFNDQKPYVEHIQESLAPAVQSIQNMQLATTNNGIHNPFVEPAPTSLSIFTTITQGGISMLSGAAGYYLTHKGIQHITGNSQTITWRGRMLGIGYTIAGIFLLTICRNAASVFLPISPTHAHGYEMRGW